MNTLRTNCVQQFVSEDDAYRRLICEVTADAIEQLKYFIHKESKAKRTDQQEVEELIYFFDHYFDVFLEATSIEVSAVRIKQQWLGKLRDQFNSGKFKYIYLRTLTK